jgi:flagellar motor switch/type III secretory pathway protein FliN
MSSTITIPAAALPPSISEELWEEAGHLPCTVSVDLPVKNLTVRALLQLESGSIVDTDIANGADVPVVVNTQLIGWAEFEIIGRSLGVRITELA